MSKANDLDQSVAEQLVRRGLKHGDGRISLASVGSGRFSDSWYVSLEDGQAAGHYVLRVAPPDDVGFLFYEFRMMRQEPALHRLIRKRTDVPVPRIVAYDFSRRLIDRDWLIMDRLTGEPLLQVSRRLSPAQAETILTDLGRHVAALHEITGRLFGYRGRHAPMQPQHSWAAAFQIMWQKLLDDCVATGLYSHKIRQVAIDLFDKYRTVFAERFTPVLCHMDLWAENILVDDGKLTGLIDLDRACWAEPGIDLAVAQYCCLTTDAFWAGYGRQPDQTQAHMIRRWFYMLYEHQKYIVINAARRRDHARAMSYVQDCVGALERFSATGKPVF